jgi:NOL1/NOP2/fmu family ribosome biogenesis protein
MRNKLKILNNKEIKEIKNKLKEQFGFNEELNYVFLQNEKGKIFITTKNISEIEFEKLKINTIGLYFAQLKEKKLRLSIDGSQLIGKDCKKNVLEIENKQLKEWLRGEEISIEGDYKDGEFLIMNNKEDYFGCGKFIQGKLLNYVSKARRVLV